MTASDARGIGQEGDVASGAPPAPNPTQVMMQLITGYWKSQAVGVAAHLGIADAVAGGSRTSEELGKAVGADPGSV
jgi:hypothetical protein